MWLEWYNEELQVSTIRYLALVGIYYLYKHPSIIKWVKKKVMRILRITRNLILVFLDPTTILQLIWLGIKTIPYMILLLLGTQFYKYTVGGLEGATIAAIDMCYVASPFYLKYWKRDEFNDTTAVGLLNDTVDTVMYFALVLVLGAVVYGIMGLIFGFEFILYFPE